MHRTRQQDLPFHGSSHHCVGADHGDVYVSAFPLHALPGRGMWKVDRAEFEAGEVHRFRCIGDAPLVQPDVHPSPRSVQENVE